MAAGYAFVTGRGQGVLVHVDVGTANTANAMHNIFRTRLPVLLMAGKAPFTTSGELVGSRDTYVHFVQEPLDQGSLVRPYVKWEWTLPSGVVVKEALRRAHTVMHSEPSGPVYLMLPRETLTQPWSVDQIHRYEAERFGGAKLGGADPGLVAELAERLLRAEHPILITAYAGRDPRASDVIRELAELAGIAVIQSNMVTNISDENPCLVGIQSGPHLRDADFGLLVDVDVPWFPVDVELNEATYWAQIDVDVLKAGSPMWTFPGSMRLQGKSALILGQLLEAVRAKATESFRAAAAARVKKLAAERKALRERAAKLAADKGAPDAINPHYLFAELNKLIDPRDIVFNEAVRNAAAAEIQIDRPLPGTMMRVAGGGLGASGGMALGAKLAAPERMMVQAVGDGTFYFNNPTAVYAASKQYKLPIFTIVLDNAGWSAVKASTIRVYPEGEARTQNEFEAELAPDAEFGKVGEAFGAYWERIADPAAVPGALERCVKEVRGGRSAILHARVTRM
jgi:acetolactate synthase-1/2/3 large subunit